MQHYYHKMSVDGVEFNGESDVLWRWNQYKLPQSLAGKSVLDIGSWDGFFAFEAKRRGATLVRAIDTIAWETPGVYERFKLNAGVLGVDVESEFKDVCSITPEWGQFDVVFFLQVLYHMHDPGLAMKSVGSVCKDELWIESQVVGDEKSPACFWPIFLGVKIPVLWPTQSSVESMIEWIGFSHEITVIWPDSARADIPGQQIRRICWKCNRKLK